MTQPEGIDVRLGAHKYRVRPQRHAYLKRELRKFIESLSDLQDMQPDDLLDVFTAKAYDVLSVFIPDLMERWEFEGYASDAAMENDQYEQDEDKSPTPPQIKEALTAAMTVNDFDWVGQLKNLIGPDLIRAQLRTAMAQWAASQQTTGQRISSSPASPSSPQENGASIPESSGTQRPTSPTPQPAS